MRFIILVTAIFCSFTSLAYKLPDTSNRSLSLSSKSEELKRLSDGVSEIAQKASSSIVFVSVSKIIKGRPTGQFNPFEFWFPELRDRMQRQQSKPQKSGIGSGFIVDLEKGYVITNNHVVDGADEISLKLANEQSYDATVVGTDKNTDVAVVQIKDKNFSRKGLSQLILDNSDTAKVGEFVVALGAPFGLESSISFGVISALSRGNLRLTKLGNFIQTDAAINPGNSGGPLINMTGDVIGMNTAIFSQDGGYNGIGFAVPANLIRKIANQLIEKGKVDRGYIGVFLQDLTSEIAGHLGLPAGTKGVLIQDVEPNGPADKSGVKQGDVFTAVDGRRVRDSSELSNKIGLKNPGDQSKITFYRDGKKRTLNLSISSFPSKKTLAQNYRNLPSNRLNSRDRGSTAENAFKFGLYLVGLDKKLRRQFALTSSSGALVIDLEPNAPGARFGLLPGDLIVATIINKRTTAIRNPSDFAKSLKNRSSALLKIERAGQFQFLGVSE